MATNKGFGLSMGFKGFDYGFSQGFKGFDQGFDQGFKGFDQGFDQGFKGEAEVVDVASTSLNLDVSVNEGNIGIASGSVVEIDLF